jgi:hypothetical protein
LRHCLLSEDGFSADDIFGSSTSMILGFDVGDHTLFIPYLAVDHAILRYPILAHHVGITWNCTKFRIGLIPVFRLDQFPKKMDKYSIILRGPYKTLQPLGVPPPQKNQDQPPVRHLPMRKQKRNARSGYTYDDLICLPGHINFGVHDARRWGGSRGDHGWVVLKDGGPKNHSRIIQA